MPLGVFEATMGAGERKEGWLAAGLVEGWGVREHPGKTSQGFRLIWAVKAHAFGWYGRVRELGRSCEYCERCRREKRNTHNHTEVFGFQFMERERRPEEIAHRSGHSNTKGIANHMGEKKKHIPTF